LIAIDIPIGLPEGGQRHADVAARQFLGRRRNSVFLAPIRSAAEALTHAEATATSRRMIGSGISQQAFALRRKILEVEHWLASATCPVFEVHPEVSFAMLLGRPATASKKTWAGMVERLDALNAAGIDLNGVDPAVGSAVAVDDMLDAAVAAWTARRLADGVARPFPHDPLPDASGRVIAIWA
jgi:predicted RNase H-like nuclease